MCPDSQSSKELRISITHTTECTTLTMHGTLNDMTANQAQGTVDELMNGSSRPKNIAVDFAHLNMISSTGLSFLVQLSQQCAKFQVGLKLLNARDQVADALRIIKVALDEIAKPSTRNNE